MENPNTPTPSGTPPEAADAGRIVEKSDLISEALGLAARLKEIRKHLKPEDFTHQQTGEISVNLWLFKTDALGCWADFRTPYDVIERYDYKLTAEQAREALADCLSSESLSDDIYSTVFSYVTDVIDANKEGGSK